MELNTYKILYLHQTNISEWDDCVLNSDLGYVYDFYQMLNVYEYEQSYNLSFAIKDVKKISLY